MPPKRKGRKSKGISAKKSNSSKSAPAPAPAGHDSSPLSSPPPTPSPLLPLAPVQKCPNEILLEIFTLYTSENPCVIRRLLLVCKQWYKLAINTTQLWTRVQFRISHPEICHPKRALEYATIPFIKACIKRAGSSLLHIDAHFGGLVDYDRYCYYDESDFGGGFGDAFFGGKKFMHFNEHDDFGGYSLHLAGGIDDYDGFVSVKDMQNSFSLLTGKNGSLMHRWASLELWLPTSDPRFDDDRNDGHLRQHVYRMLAGPTPNLTRLSIFSAEEHDYFSDSRYILPNLSALKCLYLESALELPSFKTAPIENLSMPIDADNEDDWPLVCRSTTLKTLSLWESGSSPRIPWSSLRLPLLHTLELDDANWSKFSFDFPSLKRLRVGVWEGSYLSGLPNLQPEAIELKISDEPEESKIENWLKQINLKYPSVKLLIISTSAETACRNVIARLKEQGGWPSTLEDVRIVPKENDKQVL